MPKRGRLGAIVVAVALLLGAAQARADEALVAVAANFAATLEALKPGFEAATGHRVRETTGSTGKLYAQIVAGAPFDVMLSADQTTPARLGDEGFAQPASRFTYAVGRLTLWSTDPTLIGPDGPAALADPRLRHLAIANPAIAPYGKAAIEVLRALGQWDALQARVVMGQNIGQTHALVATGAAEAGLVALSAVESPEGHAGGSRWDVPQDLFTPIGQDAILLVHGAENAAAVALLNYLRTPEVKAIIAAYGYGVE